MSEICELGFGLSDRRLPLTVQQHTSFIPMWCGTERLVECYSLLDDETFAASTAGSFAPSGGFKTVCEGREGRLVSAITIVQRYKGGFFCIALCDKQNDVRSF